MLGGGERCELPVGLRQLIWYCCIRFAIEAARDAVAATPSSAMIVFFTKALGS
jgi:hypothetical protein